MYKIDLSGCGEYYSPKRMPLASQGAAVEFAALLGQSALMHDHRRWRVLLAYAPTSPRVVGPESLAAPLSKVRGTEEWPLPVNLLVPRASLPAEDK